MRKNGFKRRSQDITLDELIKISKMSNKAIGQIIGKSEQSMSRMIHKHHESWTIAELRSVVQAIGLELTIIIDVKI